MGLRLQDKYHGERPLEPVVDLGVSAISREPTQKHPQANQWRASYRFPRGSKRLASNWLDIEKRTRGTETREVLEWSWG